MEMAVLGAMIARPPLPCASTSTCSLTSRHNCPTFHFLRQPGVVAHRREYSRVEATARHAARKENAKVRNRRQQRKFSGMSTKPRLSVFCSNRQLYAMLVDDQHPAGGHLRRAALQHRGGLWKGWGRARQGMQGAGHLRGLMLRPQRLRSRGEDVGVRGSDLPARVPAAVAEAWHGRLLALAVQSSRVFKED